MNNDRQDGPVRGRWARRAATMLMGGAIAAGGLAAAAAPAHAAPSGCTGTTTWNSYTVSCTGGDGQYRAKVNCVKAVMVNYGIRWYYSTGYGSWVSPGPDSSSRAQCPSGYGYQGGSVEYA